jgi:hypothetical protein
MSNVGHLNTKIIGVTQEDIHFVDGSFANLIKCNEILNLIGYILANYQKHL